MSERDFLRVEQGKSKQPAGRQVHDVQAGSPHASERVRGSTRCRGTVRPAADVSTLLTRSAGRLNAFVSVSPRCERNVLRQHAADRAQLLA